jgi:hypothetical protein
MDYLITISKYELIPSQLTVSTSVVLGSSDKEQLIPWKNKNNVNIAV